jgi:hypothetical protein
VGELRFYWGILDSFLFESVYTLIVKALPSNFLKIKKCRKGVEIIHLFQFEQIEKGVTAIY